MSSPLLLSFVKIKSCQRSDRSCNSSTENPVIDSTSSLTYDNLRSEEHTSELQSLMRISYAVFCLKKKKYNNTQNSRIQITAVKHRQITTNNQPQLNNTN